MKEVNDSGVHLGATSPYSTVPSVLMRGLKRSGFSNPLTRFSSQQFEILRSSGKVLVAKLNWKRETKECILPLKLTYLLVKKIQKRSIQLLNVVRKIFNDYLE